MTSRALRCLRHFPEIMQAEMAAVLNPHLASETAEQDSEALDNAARVVFGVTASEVDAWIYELENEIEARRWDNALPNPTEEEETFAYEVSRQRSHEIWEQFCKDEYFQNENMDSEIIALFSANGWDATNDKGQVLLIARNLRLPFLAALKGLAGAQMPEEGIETVALWESKIKAAPANTRRTISPTAPITIEERHRRNREAQNSTVWRPAPKRTA